MNEKRLILVAEADSSIRNLITNMLKVQEYQYLIAQNGKEVILETATHNPDIVLLDLELPDMDGVEIIEKIRTWSGVPIIVVSERCEEADKIKVLDAGADDYLIKPFSVGELMARIRVARRRMAMMESGYVLGESVFINGSLKVDYTAACVYLGEEEIHLTPNEYKLLCLMTRNVGKVLTHTFITQQIWGRSGDSDVASLRVFMATLRKKIESDPNSPQYIQTHIGIGYRMIKME